MSQQERVNKGSNLPVLLTSIYRDSNCNQVITSAVEGKQGEVCSLYNHNNILWLSTCSSSYLTVHVKAASIARRSVGLADVDSSHIRSKAIKSCRHVNAPGLQAHCS